MYKNKPNNEGIPARFGGIGKREGRWGDGKRPGKQAGKQAEKRVEKRSEKRAE